MIKVPTTIIEKPQTAGSDTIYSLYMNFFKVFFQRTLTKVLQELFWRTTGFFQVVMLSHLLNIQDYQEKE